MNAAPYTPVTLKVIKYSLKESLNAHILNFLCKGLEQEDIEEVTNLLAQEFDKKLNITPLVIQSSQGIDDLSATQLLGQQVIILLPFPVISTDADTGYMRRTLAHSRALDAIKYCKDTLVIILQGCHSGFNGNMFPDLGTKSMYVADSSFEINHTENSLNLICDRGHSRKNLPIHDRILGILG